MTPVEERGYIIPAVNTQDVDYIACAELLAKSIRQWHPDANISIITEDKLPYGNQGGWANDWQMFAASPYRQTIKLEADMIATSPVDHWWSLFEKRDLVISQGARTFYNEPAKSRFYRKFFDANNLSPFRIVYEDFVQDYAGTLQRLFAHLGRPDAKIVEPRLQRQSDERNEEMYERFLAERADMFRKKREETGG